MTEQELGNTIWGLGQAGVQFSPAASERPVAEIPLISAVLNDEIVLQRQAVIAILQGLSCSGDLVWSMDLSEDIRSALLSSIENCLESYSESANRKSVEDAKFASNAINCLGNNYITFMYEFISMEVFQYIWVDSMEERLVQCSLFLSHFNLRR